MVSRTLLARAESSSEAASLKGQVHHIPSRPLTTYMLQQQACTYAHPRWEHLRRRHGHRMDHRLRHLLSQTVQ